MRRPPVLPTLQEEGVQLRRVPEWDKCDNPAASEEVPSGWETRPLGHSATGSAEQQHGMMEVEVVHLDTVLYTKDLEAQAGGTTED